MYPVTKPKSKSLISGDISYKVIGFLFLIPVDLAKGFEIPAIQKAEIATTYVLSSNMKQPSFVLF